jgi:hypothetical protein
VNVNEPLVVSVPEAAVLLSVSEGLIYQLLDKGLCLSCHVGHDVVSFRAQQWNRSSTDR